MKDDPVEGQKYKSKTNFRSAITGMFVSVKHAILNPKTTVKEIYRWIVRSKQS